MSTPAQKAEELKRKLQEKLNKIMPKISATQQQTNNIAAPAAQMEESRQKILEQRHQSHSNSTSNSNSKKTEPPKVTLDDNGNVIDMATGRIITIKKHTSTSLINQKNKSSQMEDEPQLVERENPYLAHLKPEKSKIGYDPSKRGPKVNRPKRTIEFNPEGKYIQEAKRIRLLEEEKKNLEQQLELRNNSSDTNATIIKKEAEEDQGLEEIPISKLLSSFTNVDYAKKMKLITWKHIQLGSYKPIPQVEWWDSDILLAQDESGYGDCKIRDKIITHYEEHPVEMRPIWEPSEEVRLKIMLTKKERKKANRAIRVQRELEKQKKVKLGLMPPPPPKANLKNFMRVYLNTGVIDPTELERKIRSEIQQRIQNHEERNNERKLTFEQKIEKRLTKLQKDAEKELCVAVFLVKDFTHPLNRDTVNRKAQELLITGTVIIHKDTTIIIAEGGPYAMSKFIHTVCERIDWNAALDKTKLKNETIIGPEITFHKATDVANVKKEDQLKLEEEEEQKNRNRIATLIERKGNSCTLIWRGSQLKRNFTNFKFQQFQDPFTARKFLRDFGVAQFWDICYKGFDDYIFEDQ